MIKERKSYLGRYFYSFLSRVKGFGPLPNWVNYIATDKNGVIWGFEEQPIIVGTVWATKNGGRCHIIAGVTEYLTLPENKNWGKHYLKLMW